MQVQQQTQHQHGLRETKMDVSSVTSTEAAGAAKILSAVPGMLATAHELRLDVQLLLQHHKQLTGRAKKLCSSFRAAGRAIRVRALTLKQDLHRYSAPGNNSTTTAAAAGSNICIAGWLPTNVAQSVLLHWNEVEVMLGQLHSTCEELLHVPPADEAAALTASQLKRRDGHSSSRGQGWEKQAARRCGMHIMQRCENLLEQLLSLSAACHDLEAQRGQRGHVKPALSAVDSKQQQKQPHKQQRKQQQKQQQLPWLPPQQQQGHQWQHPQQPLDQRTSFGVCSSSHHAADQLHVPAVAAAAAHVPASISSSSCSSEGLGSLLVSITQLLAAADMKLVNKQAPPSGTHSSNAGLQVCAASDAATTAAAHEKGVHKLAAGETKQELLQLGLPSGVGQEDGATRRASRAALLARLKLMQQGGGTVGS
jgi:hypothetical protein